MRALIDACVLVPDALRRIVLNVAAEGLIVPLWSARIIAEWQHAAARRGTEAAARAAEAWLAMQTAFPDATVPPAPEIEAALRLPDPDDCHVLAAAIAGRAEAVMTFNHSDFPARVLAAHGLRRESPDSVLHMLWSGDPATVARAIAAARRTMPPAGPPDAHAPIRAFLRRAGLPRLGKAMSAP
jgi:predicted nucleic acid-binding protein